MSLGFSLACNAQSYDLLLKGGHVIDPKSGRSASLDVAIQGRGGRKRYDHHGPSVQTMEDDRIALPPPLPPPPPPRGCGGNGPAAALSMEGRVVLITGANSGVGLETARALHRRGAIVILGCRSRDRALVAMKDIDPSRDDDGAAGGSGDMSASRSSGRGGRMHFLPLDLTSQKSVRDASSAFRRMGLPLHVLINNAGVMMKDKKVTEDACEVTLAAYVREVVGTAFCTLVTIDHHLMTVLLLLPASQHLGHFLLTDLLLPTLRKTAYQFNCPSRVITVSSSLYSTAKRFSKHSKRLEPGIDLNDLQCEHRAYTLFEQYAQSKLANILFSLELGRREMRRCSVRCEDRNAKDGGASSQHKVQPPDITTPAHKKKKKARQRLILLTPTEVAEEIEGEDEMVLGFHDIV